jgi:hypothetical protein
MLASRRMSWSAPNRSRKMFVVECDDADRPKLEQTTVSQIAGSLQLEIKRVQLLLSVGEVRARRGTNRIG